MLPRRDLTILIEEIRSDAVHENIDLKTILCKCKVLAGEIGSTDLDQWSTWESLGYPTEQPVPHYRLWPLQLIGRFAGPFGLAKTATIPLTYLPEYARNFRDAYECRESATLIEQSLNQAENGVSTVYTGDLHLSIGRTLYRGYKCVAVRAEVSAARLTLAIYAVRDHILNVTNTLLQQHRETLSETEETSASYFSHEDQKPGLVVRRSPDALLQEEIELERAWARVRSTYRSDS